MGHIGDAYEPSPMDPFHHGASMHVRGMNVLIEVHKLSPGHGWKHPLDLYLIRPFVVAVLDP
jgi:hypothetical protein